MKATKYDNQGGVNRAKAKVNELVKKGYRLNPSKASSTYHQSVLMHGNVRERNKSIIELAEPARHKMRTTGSTKGLKN